MGDTPLSPGTPCTPVKGVGLSGGKARSKRLSGRPVGLSSEYHKHDFKQQVGSALRRKEYFRHGRQTSNDIT